VVAWPWSGSPGQRPRAAPRRGLSGGPRPPRPGLIGRRYRTWGRLCCRVQRPRRDPSGGTRCRTRASPRCTAQRPPPATPAPSPKGACCAAQRLAPGSRDRRRSDPPCGGPHRPPGVSRRHTAVQPCAGNTSPSVRLGACRNRRGLARCTVQRPGRGPLGRVPSTLPTRRGVTGRPDRGESVPPAGAASAAPRSATPRGDSGDVLARHGTGAARDAGRSPPARLSEGRNYSTGPRALHRATAGAGPLRASRAAPPHRRAILGNGYSLGPAGVGVTPRGLARCAAQRHDAGIAPVVPAAPPWPRAARRSIPSSRARPAADTTVWAARCAVQRPAWPSLRATALHGVTLRRRPTGGGTWHRTAAPRCSGPSPPWRSSRPLPCPDSPTPPGPLGRVAGPRRAALHGAVPPPPGPVMSPKTTGRCHPMRRVAPRRRATQGAALRGAACDPAGRAAAPVPPVAAARCAAQRGAAGPPRTAPDTAPRRRAAPCNAAPPGHPGRPPTPHLGAALRRATARPAVAWGNAHGHGIGPARADRGAGLLPRAASDRAVPGPSPNPPPRRRAAPRSAPPLDYPGPASPALGSAVARRVISDCSLSAPPGRSDDRRCRAAPCNGRPRGGRSPTCRPRPSRFRATAPGHPGRVLRTHRSAARTGQRPGHRSPPGVGTTRGRARCPAQRAPWRSPGSSHRTAHRHRGATPRAAPGGVPLQRAAPPRSSRLTAWAVRRDGAGPRRASPGTLSQRRVAPRNARHRRTRRGGGP